MKLLHTVLTFIVSLFSNWFSAFVLFKLYTWYIAPVIVLPLTIAVLFCLLMYISYIKAHLREVLVNEEYEMKHLWNNTIFHLIHPALALLFGWAGTFLF
jgi:hypothetical protein